MLQARARTVLVAASVLAGCSGGDGDTYELRFRPDMASLLADACAGDLTLPSPLGDLRLLVEEDAAEPRDSACADGPPGGGAPGAPAFRGKVAGQPDSDAVLTLGQGVHGHVRFHREASDLGPAGAYEVSYEGPIREGPDNLAWVRSTPEGQRSTTTV